MPTYYPQIRSGITSQRPYSTTASFLHSTNEMESGPRYSALLRLNPLNHFEIQHSSIGTVDLGILENFFNSMSGRFGGFIYLDPAGNLIPSSENFADGSPDPFGGNRAGLATTVNQLVLPAGGAQGIILTTSIWAFSTSANQQINIGLANNYATLTLPQNTWKRIYFTTVVPDNNPVTAIVFTPVATKMFGIQCAALPGPGAYAKTPEMLGYHPACRLDTDQFVAKYNSIDECSVSLPIQEFAQ